MFGLLHFLKQDPVSIGSPPVPSSCHLACRRVSHACPTASSGVWKRSVWGATARFPVFFFQVGSLAPRGPINRMR